MRWNEIEKIVCVWNHELQTVFEKSFETLYLWFMQVTAKALKEFVNIVYICSYESSVHERHVVIPVAIMTLTKSYKVN